MQTTLPNAPKGAIETKQKHVKHSGSNASILGALLTGENQQKNVQTNQGQPTRKNRTMMDRLTGKNKTKKVRISDTVVGEPMDPDRSGPL